MTIRRSGWFVLAAFFAGLWLLLQAGQAGDWILRTMVWGTIGWASVVALSRMFQGHEHRSDPFAGLPSKLRRWMIGE
jgi:hypothetical protein